MIGVIAGDVIGSVHEHGPTITAQTLPADHAAARRINPVIGHSRG